MHEAGASINTVVCAWQGKHEEGCFGMWATQSGMQEEKNEADEKVIGDTP